MLYFISICLVVNKLFNNNNNICIFLRRFIVEICFHTFKNVIKKSVYWTYQQYFE